MCKCNKCSGDMNKTKIGGNSAIHNIGAVFTFLLGLLFLFVFWPAGLVLILIAVLSGSGNKAKKVMLCGDCGYYFNSI